MRAHFRIASSALGHRESVAVHIYDTLEQLRAAARAWHPGEDFDRAAGVVQSVWTDDGRVRPAVVRLTLEALQPAVICHELHHVATALYGLHVGDGTPDLGPANEPFAHLFSDLLDATLVHLEEAPRGA